MEIEPPLFGEELEQNLHSDEEKEGEEQIDSGQGSVDEATEANTANSTEAQGVKIKHVIRKPQPKLDAIRLLGSRGIGVLQNSFSSVNFKGQGHETEDLAVIMKTLEHWAHRLFPKMPFDDCLTQIEKLGRQRSVQTSMKRIRLDLFQPEQQPQPPEGESEPLAPLSAEPQRDLFDELVSTMPQSPLPSTNAPLSHTTPLPAEMTTARQDSSPKQLDSVNGEVNSNSSQPAFLTLEQRERIARNRLAAIERRRNKQQTLEAEKHQTSENES